MSQQFYKKTPPLDPKIYLPGRTQETFPSGLLKVTRSYACLPSEVGSVQTVLGGGASVLSVRDQLKAGNVLPDKGAQTSDAVGGPIIIFPDPTELKRDDGMIEFRVTAYGRSTLNFNITQSDVRGTYFETFRNEAANVPFSFSVRPALNRQYIVRGVLQTSQGLDVATSIPSELQVIVRPGQAPDGLGPGSGFVQGYGSPLVSGITDLGDFIQTNLEGTIETTFRRTITINTFLVLQNLESTNFGAYTEFVATWLSGGIRRDSTFAISSKAIET
jgi:hypothetical protein